VVLLLGAVLTLAAAPSAQAAAAPTAAAASTCTVPNVYGLTSDAAVYQLRLAGFSFFNIVHDESDLTGTVYSVSPAVGSQVPCDSTIALRTAKCVVPDVHEWRIKPAMDMITARHLKPKVNGQGADWVMSQSPLGGTQVKCRSTVNLTPGPAGTDPR